MNKNELDKQLASADVKIAKVAQLDNKKEQKLNEKNKKIIDWLIEQENYEKTNQENILEKYGVGEIVLDFSEPQEGKLDFEVQIIDEKVWFTIRIQKFLEREFKKFYRNADEVKKALEIQREKYLSRLAELGLKEFFKEKAEWLFSDDEELKKIALKMASGEIDIDDYSDGRSKQIEVALNGKRFDEIKQSDFANYQEYDNYLKGLKAKKKKLISLQRAIEEDWEEIKDRQWYGMWDWLRTDKREKEAKQLLEEAKETRESLAKKWAEEYFNSLPKTTEVEYENVEKSVSEKIAGWQKEILQEEKKTWTDEQWKQYYPNIEYNGKNYRDKSYNEGEARELQLEKISSKEHRWGQQANDFYREIVDQQKESFEASHDSCWHCLEAETKTTFKLVLKTKWRLIYICSRCENTEYFFDIAEWKEGEKNHGN